MADEVTQNGMSDLLIQYKVILGSLEGNLFSVNRLNISCLCNTFPYDLDEYGPIIHTCMDTTTLEVLIRFLYPTRAPPDLTVLSFESLHEVISVVSCWGMPLAKVLCQYELRKYASRYPMRILNLVEDSSILLESLSPYIGNISAELLLVFGVSPDLCLRWATFREKSVFAMVEAAQVLDHHDECEIWRRNIKPFMKQKLFILGEPRVFLLNCHMEEDIVLTGVNDVFKVTLEKIDGFWNIGDSHSSGSEDQEMDEEIDNGNSEDLDMESNSEDVSFSSGLGCCCKTYLQLWKGVVIREIKRVKF